MNLISESRAILGQLRGSQKLVLLRIFIVINIGAFLLATWNPFDNAWTDVAFLCAVYALESCFMLWLGLKRGIGFRRQTAGSAVTSSATVVRPEPMIKRYLGMAALSLAVSVLAGLIVTNMNDNDSLTTGQSIAFFAVEAVVMGFALLQGLCIGWGAGVIDGFPPSSGSVLSPEHGDAAQARSRYGATKLGWVILLGVVVIGGMFAFLGYQHSRTDTANELHAAAIDNSAADENTAPAAANAAPGDLIVPASPSNPYPKGMAQNANECGQPGYNSDNFVCHPIGQPIAGSSMDNSGLSPAINAINDQLAKIGTLSVTMVNNEGYPVYDMECNAQGQCVNGTGAPMGSISDIAKEMTTVRKSDIAKYGYRCNEVCIDSQGNIIGRPEASS